MSSLFMKKNAKQILALSGVDTMTLHVSAALETGKTATTVIYTAIQYILDHGAA